jgi:hypothetical protein
MGADADTDAELFAALSQPISDKDPNARPECFTSTFQECMFIVSVTMAVAMTSFLTGAITVMSSFAARDLGMTNAEITWMNAATSLEFLHFSHSKPKTDLSKGLLQVLSSSSSVA